MNPLSNCLGQPEKSLSGEGEHYHQSCVMPRVKHPETIHVWGCFSAKGVGSLTILPKNTAMNKEWYQHILREQLLPTIQEQNGDEQCIFQHDGAPCHKAKVITKWLREQNINILGPWPETPQALIPLRTCGQSSRGGWKNKTPQIMRNSKH